MQYFYKIMNLKNFHLFSSIQRNMAKYTPRKHLEGKYHESERKLEEASKKGDWETFNKVMKNHQNYEYALHLQNYRSNKKQIKQARKLAKKNKRKK